ncbi:MAG: chromosomal replication initiator protein DnaA [Actinobacteria bacterium]|nr:chromosomal replication initiator protein DnaA [Actinomycetota bacterium]MCL6104286.1 chromosomal replication initiator protein DnaA [Actinomycetota bacterium]
MKQSIELWDKCSIILKDRLGEGVWKTLLMPVNATNYKDNSLVISVPNRIVRDRLINRYLPVILETLSTITGVSTDLDIEIDTSFDLPNRMTVDNRSNGGNISVQTQPVPPATGTGESMFNPSYVFDAFVIASSNRFAHAAALAVAESPSHSYNPLFIYGHTGLGKTHLLHAIGNYILKHMPTNKIRYVSTETFLNEFVNAIRINKTVSFKRRYRECDILLIDDIQFIEGKESLQEEFFHTFNSLYESSKQIVITSDRPPRSISTLEERLRSRFLSGLITDIQPPELETRMAILQKKMRSEDIAIPNDVLEFIAINITNNIRELEGALNRVIAYAKLTNQPITGDLVKVNLSDIIVKDQFKRILPQTIINICSEYFRFGVEEIVGPNRRRPLVLARQICMYIIRELTDLSYPQIANIFNGRDHTTAIHAIEKISSLMKQKKQVYGQVNELIIKIKSEYNS